MFAIVSCSKLFFGRFPHNYIPWCLIGRGFYILVVPLKRQRAGNFQNLWSDPDEMNIDEVLNICTWFITLFNLNQVFFCHCQHICSKFKAHVSLVLVVVNLSFFSGFLQLLREINGTGRSVRLRRQAEAKPYITAHFQNLPAEFKLGDGHVYGAFLNRPLVNGQEYVCFVLAILELGQNVSPLCYCGVHGDNVLYRIIIILKILKMLVLVF